MKKFLTVLLDYMKRSDSLLLFLCVSATIFGIVVISSVTRTYSDHSYVYTQAVALVIGIFLYIVFSVIDLDIIADRWKLLLVFDILFICSLFVFGVAGTSGNRAWIRFGGFGGIQPAEVVKIPFTIILAKQISLMKDNRGIDHPLSVFQLAVHFGLMFGLIIISSSDLGSALVYFFIFAVVLFVAGLKIYWFLLAGGILAGLIPIFWRFLSEYQKDRILAPYDPTIDTTGLDILWQSNQSKAAIASGGFFGQGLYHGVYTQSSGNAIPQQHTDFIFSAIGEELGFVGCILVILLLAAIICRCIYIGLKSKSTLGMLVCVGLASMLIFQMLENIGMCLGLTPVIGLTLPFISYGGSSIITLFAAMGIISGVKMRPKPSRFVRFSSY